jgi:hypothetical protein
MGLQGQVATINAREAARGKTLPVDRADKQIADAQAAIDLITRRMYL